MEIRSPERKRRREPRAMDGPTEDRDTYQWKLQTLEGMLGEECLQERVNFERNSKGKSIKNILSASSDNKTVSTLLSSDNEQCLIHRRGFQGLYKTADISDQYSPLYRHQTL
jgi:hypothetical protein